MLDILILAMIAVFLISRLYMAFGANAEDKMPRIIIKRIDNADNAEEALKELELLQKDLEKNYCANENRTLECRLDNLLEKVKDFNVGNFINSANRVFELVLQAFYDNKMENVKNLLSKKVYDTFKEAINSRLEQKQTTEVEFICFEKTEIKDVRMLKNSVKIIVEFVTQQINILRAADGKVIAGDENFIQKITDVWTFERTLNAKDNKWVLVSTKKMA